jgi:hypothetical protein
MCRRIDCPECGRPTFAGCGMHVEQVLGDVPVADRCRCRERRAQDSTDPTSGKPSGPLAWLRSLTGGGPASRSSKR